MNFIAKLWARAVVFCGDILPSISSRCNRYRATKEVMDHRSEASKMKDEIESLRSQILELQNEVKKLESINQIQEIEIESLSMVNERDRQRIRAEIESFSQHRTPNVNSTVEAD